MKRMFLRSGLKPGSTGNVVQLDPTELVGAAEVESATAPQPATESPFTDDGTAIFLDHDYNRYMSPSIAPIVDNSVVYIAGWVVKKATTKVTCGTCRTALVSPQVPSYDRAYSLLVFKNRGGLVVPSQGTISVIKCTEKAIRQLVDIHKLTRQCAQAKVEYTVKATLGSNDVFSLGNHILETHYGIQNHQYTLISTLVHIYFTLRQHHMVKLFNLKEQGSSVRHTLTKTILFKGQ